MCTSHAALPQPCASAVRPLALPAELADQFNRFTAAILFVVSDRAVARSEYLTPPQSLLLATGGYILAIACESVVCFYICKWNFFKQRRMVRRSASGGCLIEGPACLPL